VTYLAVVNREHYSRNVTVPLRAMGLNAPSYAALDVRAGQGMQVDGDFEVPMPERSFRYFVLRPGAGLLRTSSVVSNPVADEAAGLVAMTMSGPAASPGFVQLVAPRPGAVLVDGVPAVLSGESGQTLAGAGIGEDGANRYAYDERSGILTLNYAHTGRRVVEVRW
jgi:hypothetical protein